MIKLNEPPFIAGLRSAKQILLQLKHRKQQQNLPSNSKTNKSHLSPPLQSKQSLKHQQSKSIELPQIDFQHEQNDRKGGYLELRDKINRIGKELYECYCENQEYELIFNKLGQYYGEKKGIVEENEQLKKKTFEFKQIIEDYKQKIKNNYDSIQHHQVQLSEMKKKGTEVLAQYLMAEAEEAQEVALPQLYTKSVNLKNRKKMVKSDEVEQEIRLTLSFQTLAKEVARRPVRRVQPQQSQVRRFYQSQLYSL